jgi:hypothetical protein
MFQILVCGVLLVFCGVVACQKKGGDGGGGTSSGGGQTGGDGFTLSVVKQGTGTGSGVVISSPTGISCGTDCTEKYAAGTVVTLSANTGVDLASFNGWTGGCSGVGDCTLTISSDTSVAAVFKNYVNDPTVISFSNSYSTARHFSYEPDMRLDTEQYSRDFENLGTADARNVKITLVYSSGSGGTGTVYGSTSQSFSLVQPNQATTFSVFTDLNPNPSSWYYTRIVEAWVPDTSLGVTRSGVISSGTRITTTQVNHPFEGDEGKAFSIRTIQD